MPIMKLDGGSDMVLWYFSNNHVEDLVKIGGAMKKEDYHPIIIKYAVHSGKKVWSRVCYEVS